MLSLVLSSHKTSLYFPIHLQSVDNEDSIVSSGQELSSAATPEEEWLVSSIFK